jgi:hypothetical protein
MTTLADLPQPTNRCVQVWFGENLIAEYVGDANAAVQYEAGMRRRFLSLRVTNEPADHAGSPDADRR